MNEKSQNYILEVLKNTILIKVEIKQNIKSIKSNIDNTQNTFENLLKIENSINYLERKLDQLNEEIESDLIK